MKTVTIGSGYAKQLDQIGVAEPVQMIGMILADRFVAARSSSTKAR